MATGATEFIDNTIANSVFIIDVWTKKLNISREKKMHFFPNVNSAYEEDAKIGRRVFIPTIGNLASRVKSENTAITYETVADTTTTLSLNKDDYAAFAIEDITSLQESLGVREEYRKKMGYALALKVDSDLAALVAGFSQTVGTLGVDPIDDDWLRALQYLDDADAPEEGRSIIISPAAKGGLLKMDKFNRVEYIGNRGDMPTTTGLIGVTVYGAPVFVSTNMTTNGAGRDSTFMQQDAIGAVIQMKPKFWAFHDIDVLAWKIAAEQISGEIEVRDNHGVWIKTK